MEDPGVGDVRTHPICLSSAREADLVRGPAYDGMLSPVVPAPLLASPLSALLPPASKIHHFVMGNVRACLTMHGSAREADTVRGPACDGMLSPLFMMDTYCVRLRALPSASSSAREADLVRGPACDVSAPEMGSLPQSLGDTRACAVLAATQLSTGQLITLVAS